jgi:hypothetical protein
MCALMQLQPLKLFIMNNYEKAIELLKTAKNVTQWNELRESIKSTLTQSELCQIDSSGLIVEVLGKN